MFNNNNPSIQIEAVENGFIVHVTIPPTWQNDSPNAIIEALVPTIERAQNRLTGDDWKNKMEDEIQDSMPKPVKPYRQYVCVDWDAVLVIINAHRFTPTGTSEP